MSMIIRSAQSVAGKTEGCFRYNRSSVKAAFFFTNVLEVLYRIERYQCQVADHRVGSPKLFLVKAHSRADQQPMYILG
jgi:hypothetical protein